VNTTFSFIENLLIGATDYDGDSLNAALDTGDSGPTRTRRLNLFNKISSAELVFGKRVNIGNGLAARTLI
jgi:hypothetical protein